MKVKFGLITDSHFSPLKENFRTDNFFETAVSKFQQSYDFFKREQVDFVLHGGDVFNRYRSYSNPMMVSVRNMIVSSDLITYFIWGQHDLLGYNRESGKNSNLDFLRRISDGKLIEITDNIKLKGFRIYASHVDQNPQDIINSIDEKSTTPSIVLAHSLLYDSRSKTFGEIDVRKFGKIKPILVLSGDLHTGIEKVEIQGTTYYNPGSLMRTSREKRKPKVAVIEIEPFLSEWQINIKEFFPECEDFPFPEEEVAGSDIAVNKEQDSDKYIESFAKFKVESKDIFDILEKVGEEHNIDKEVLTYIKSKRK